MHVDAQDGKTNAPARHAAGNKVGSWWAPQSDCQLVAHTIHASLSKMGGASSTNYHQDGSAATLGFNSPDSWSHKSSSTDGDTANQSVMLPEPNLLLHMTLHTHTEPLFSVTASFRVVQSPIALLHLTCVVEAGLHPQL